MSIGNESVAGEYEVSIQVSRSKIFKNAYQKKSTFFSKALYIFGNPSKDNNGRDVIIWSAKYNLLIWTNILSSCGFKNTAYVKMIS